MWRPDEVSTEVVAPDVDRGLFFIASADGVAAGTLKLQLTDSEFWPEVEEPNSAFIHRLAVRRAFARCGLSSAMVAWAADRARSLDRRYLRLDCDPSRLSLCAFYERNGFRLHSQAQTGRLFSSRYEMDLASGAPDPTALWRAEQLALLQGLNIV